MWNIHQLNGKWLFQNVQLKNQYYYGISSNKNFTGRKYLQSKLVSILPEEVLEYVFRDMKHEGQALVTSASFSIHCQETEVHPSNTFRLNFNHYGVDSLFLELSGNKVNNNKVAIKNAKLFLQNLHVTQEETSLRIRENKCEYNAWLPWISRNFILDGMAKALENLKSFYPHCSLKLKIQGHPSIARLEPGIDKLPTKDYTQSFQFWFNKCQFIDPELFSEILSLCKTACGSYLIAWKVEKTFLRSYRINNETNNGEIFGLLEVCKNEETKNNQYELSFESFFAIDKETLNDALGLPSEEGDYR